jgi:hypothetical protein
MLSSKFAGALALGALSLFSQATVADGQAAAAAGGSSDAAAKSEVISIINEKAQNAKLFSFDYTFPSSPALTLAGISPDKTTTSTSLKPFVLALPGLIDSGSGQSSAALDMSVAWLLGTPGRLQPKAYQAEDNYLGRLEYRTRLGVAFYRGDDGGGDASKAKPSRAAIGLSMSLLDTSDPAMATLDPLRSIATEGLDAGVWYSCLAKPGGGMAPYVADEGNKRAIAEQAQAQITRYLVRIGGSNGSRDAPLGDLNASTGSITPLSDAERADVQSMENDITRNSDVRLSEQKSKPFTRGRLVDEYNALQTYITTDSPQKIKADQQTATFIEGCQKKASTAAQHNASLQIGGGAVWSGDPGKWANFKNPNAAVWVAGRFPLELTAPKANECGDDDQQGDEQESVTSPLFMCWLIGGSGRYSAGEMVQTGNKTTPQFKANVAEGWIGLERMDANTKLAGYYGYLDQSAAHTADKAFSKHGGRWLVSAAYSLSFLQEGLWIQGSYGAAQGSVTTLDDKVAMLSLSFGPPSIGSAFSGK